MASRVEQAPLGDSQVVLRGKLLPWIIAATAVLTQRDGARGVLFFGILAARFVPRAIPTLVSLRADIHGSPVRDVWLSERFNGADVVGPFAVTSTLLGDAVNFTRRCQGETGTSFRRATVQNSFGLSTQDLADLLNQRRRHFLCRRDPDAAE